MRRLQVRCIRSLPILVLGFGYGPLARSAGSVLGPPARHCPGASGSRTSHEPRTDGPTKSPCGSELKQPSPSHYYPPPPPPPPRPYLGVGVTQNNQILECGLNPRRHTKRKRVCTAPRSFSNNHTTSPTITASTCGRPEPRAVAGTEGGRLEQQAACGCLATSLHRYFARLAGALGWRQQPPGRPPGAPQGLSRSTQHAWQALGSPVTDERPLLCARPSHLEKAIETIEKPSETADACI